MACLTVDPTILSALPTDSLYKFMALAGLGFVLASALLPSRVYQQTMNQLLEIGRRLAEQKIHSDFMKNAADISQKATDRLTRSVEAGMDVSADLQRHGEALREQTEALLQHELRGATIDADMEVVQSRLLPHLLVLKWAQVVGFALGAVITVFGFTLWYVQVQQYTDQIQRLQLRQAQLQVAKAEREEREAATPPGPSVDVSSAVPEGAPGAGGVQVGESP